MQVLEASVLQGLTYDARARSYVKHHGAAVKLETTFSRTLRALVDDVLGLREVDNTRPLVVSFRGEASIPLGDILLLGQVVVELIYDESALICLRFRGVRLAHYDLLKHLILWSHFVLLNNL